VQAALVRIGAVSHSTSLTATKRLPYADRSN